MKSETSECRDDLLKFCRGTGVDLGYGGDAIKPNVITMDMPAPYTKLGNDVQHLSGDARNLYWFKDNVLDYVFSSHLLEDFLFEKIPIILKEWIRVVKPEGFIILYMPDEQRYRKYCEERGEPRNEGHKNVDMSLQRMIEIVNQIPNVSIEHQKDNAGRYSFQLVLKKGGN